MKKQIEFYFDLGSPYSYVGFYRLLKIAEEQQAEIIWKPILLGGVFKATGNSSPMAVPAKARYSMMDLKRWSKYWQIPVKMNPHFPINTLHLMRLLTAVQLYQPDRFVCVLKGLYDAMFGHPRNLNDVQEFMALGEELGIDTVQAQTWLDDEKVKARLKALTEEAVERGVFGAPTCFVDNEQFWGVDHLHFVEMALQSGTEQ